jgi:hypothetical protein
MGGMGGLSGVLLGYGVGQGINFGIILLAHHFNSKAFALFITPL